MNVCRMITFSVIALTAVPVATAENLYDRPDVNSAKPIATCKLPSLGAGSERAPMLAPGGGYSTGSMVEDPLANYERTDLGNWRMPAAADPSDPWIRLLILGPKRPMVVDVAVLIDGKTFREAREEWVDELLAAGGDAIAPAETSEAPRGSKAISGDGDAAASSDREPASDESAKDRPLENAPVVAPRFRQAPTMRERLANYVAAGGPNVDRDEIHWLIAEWGSGPGLIVLGSALSWQHAGVASLKSLFDEDVDGALSVGEIAQAKELLRRADLDGNDIVELNEIHRSAARNATARYPIGHSLVMLLDANTDWESLFATVGDIYAGRDDAAFSSKSKFRQLCNESADLTLRVDFSRSAPSTNAVTVLGASKKLQDVEGSEDAISAALGADTLEIVASPGPSVVNSSSQEAQIAIGAMVEPNPMMRLLDQDQDERLTMREYEQLDEMFASLDRNADGTVAASELPIPIRLGITLGPHVHALLAMPRRAARPLAPRNDSTAPEWFISMDRNGDRDVAREEFLGTSEQFEKLDGDGDGLLNATEALAPGAEQ